MKNTIKFAALGAMALAASSTAALAGSELLPGITAGLALGAPLPEGVYDISIGLVQQAHKRRRGSRVAGVADLVDTLPDRWRPYRPQRHDGLG